MHTCVLLALAFQQGQAGAPTGPVAAESDIVHLVRQASPINQFILVLLLLISAISWGVILYKIWQFQRAQRQSASFLEIFRRSSKFSEVQAVCRTLAESPLVGIFQAGYAELTTQLKAANTSTTTPGPEGRPAGSPARPTLKSFDALDRALLRASGVEMQRLEKRVTFLATAASISPYIGLFGTVWGILIAFQKIGGAGGTSLAVVGPSIAEALIATAAGLFAAIPAVYFYNHFTHQVKNLAQAMEDFSLEFLTIAERNFM